MDNPVAVGSLIHRNHAAFAQTDECLTTIAEIMPIASRVNRRKLRRITLEVRWTRAQIRVVGWALRLLDPR